MISIVIKRLLLAPLLLFLASVVAFAFPWLTGVNPARAALRARLSEGAPDPETVARLESELGLDEPLVLRYLYWAADLVRGDLGLSYVDREPVSEQLLSGLSVTGSLVAISLAVGLLAGILLGALAAASGGRLERAVTAVSGLGIMIPEYVIGPTLVLVFAITLGALPVAGWDGPANAVLPVLTLTAPVFALSTQLARAEVTDALLHPSVIFARSKGLSEAKVLFRHALPNALTSITAVVGLWVASILGGSVIVEVIFNIPGLGRALYTAVVTGDLPMLQGGLVLMVAVAIAVNLVSDLLQAAADPRQRLS